MSDREQVKLDEESEEEKSARVATGAYLNTGVIISVEDFSNYPGQAEINTYKSGKIPEMCLILTIDDTRRKNKLFYLTGFFNRDKSEAINGWNEWNNPIKRFLIRIAGECRYNKDNLSVPQDLLDKVIGKSFQFVSFITAHTWINDKGEDKPSYSDWNKVFGVEESIGVIKEEFSEDAEYLMSPKKPDKYRYCPAALEQYSQGDTSFNYGENSKTGVKTSSKDDLPEEPVI